MFIPQKSQPWIKDEEKSGVTMAMKEVGVVEEDRTGFTPRRGGYTRGF